MQHDITRPIALEPCIGNRRARDSTSQPFERPVRAGATACRLEAMCIGAQCWRGVFTATGVGLQAQHLLPGAMRNSVALGLPALRPICVKNEGASIMQRLGIRVRTAHRNTQPELNWSSPWN